jgi:hypothetical protein
MLKFVFNIKSTKECMNIFLLSNLVFHLCEVWEKNNILDDNGDVLTPLLTLIEKSMFGYFSNME